MTELHDKLNAWRAPEPSPELAGRIAAHALTRRTPLETWREELSLAIGDWRYGMAYKAAALAACILIAAGVGVTLREPPAEDPVLDEVAFIMGI